MRTVIPQTKVQSFPIPKMEIMGSGYSTCPGCGASLAMRYALKALGRKTVLVIPQDWSSMADCVWYHPATNVPVFHATIQTVVSTASGIRAGLDFQGQGDVQVVVWVENGGGMKTAFQTLSEAVETNENFIYVCFANQMVEKVGSSPRGAREDLVEIMAAHGIPYLATCAVAYPEDFINKFKKAKRIKGTRLIQVHSPCPSIWKIPQNLTIHVARLAVHTKMFPLYEVQNGKKYAVNIAPQGRPVEEYLRLQGRFQHMTKKQIQTIQRRVDGRWERLLKRMKG